MSDGALAWLHDAALRLVDRIVAMLERSGGTAIADAHRVALQDLARLGAPEQARPATLERLVTRLGLKPVDIDLLLLAGIAEQHEVLSALLSALHPRGEPWASVGLAARLFCEREEERLPFVRRLLTGPAVASGLISVEGDAPTFERTIRLAPAMWWVLGGIDQWPRDLEPVRVQPEAAGLEDWLDTEAAERATEVITRDASVLVLVLGDGVAMSLSRAAVLMERAGRRAVAFKLGPRVDPNVERWLSLHCIARGVVPVVAIVDEELGAVSTVTWFENHPGVAALAFVRNRVRVEGERPAIAVESPRLDPTQRAVMWRALAPHLADDADRLSARYTLEPSEARAVVEDAQAVATARSGAALNGSGPPRFTMDDIAEAVRARGGITLSAGVDLIRPTATWEQLVLRPDRKAQLTEAVARLERQSEVLDGWGFLAGRAGARGVRLLMSGPPGTGKTMSAEVLAQRLGVDLLVVDISRVVSKWIGETEKNLARVFDIAERTQAVLLFDEADALFGKRTEVSDAHDRYANLETAFLLSRLERLEGMAVLSTNLRQNIDPAFLRRLEFVIDFEEPEYHERLELWQKHVPKTAPLADDVEFEQLADLYPVVGGLIRNAAVAAGFVAAGEKTKTIHQSHFLRALKREYEKAGRAFPGLPPGYGTYLPMGGSHAHDAV